MLYTNKLMNCIHSLTANDLWNDREFFLPMLFLRAVNLLSEHKYLKKAQHNIDLLKKTIKRSTMSYTMGLWD